VAQEEILDVLDEQGKIIGTASRDQVMQSDSKNFRLVSAFIRSVDGLFYMLRRAHTKKAFGGCFASVGGCVQAGESYDQALFREIEEEVFLKPEEYTWRLLGYTTPQHDDTFGHVAVYELITSQKLCYNTDDFCEMRIIALDELYALAQTPEVSHNLPIYVKKFYTP